MSLVKEGIKKICNAKKNKTVKVLATEKNKDNNSEFEIKDFLNDLSESDNDE
jgi:hypothetical protein